MRPRSSDCAETRVPVRGFRSPVPSRRPAGVPGAARPFALCLALCLAALLPAMADPGPVRFTVNGVRFNGAALHPFPVPLPAGADVALRIPLSPGGIFYSLRVAGGWEDRFILRDGVTGEPVAKPGAPEDLHWFMFPNLQLDTGFGLHLSGAARPAGSPEGAAAGSPSAAAPELFLLGRYRLEDNRSALPATRFPDARGLSAVSFMAGAGFDGVRSDRARMKSGMRGEVSVEYAPAGLAFSGGTDFLRANLQVAGFHPLAASAHADPGGRVSVYAAWMASADWAVGDTIPLYVLTSFGGRDPRDGVGKSVRGFMHPGYESPRKAVASAEVRAIGPALFGIDSVRPLAYAFGDCGVYAGLDRAGSFADASAFIASAGSGIALGVLDFMYLGLRAGFRFPFGDPVHDVYFPGASRFFWDMAFLLHFWARVPLRP